MISYQQALSILDETASRERDRETIESTSFALKMTLSRDVVGEEDVPPFDNSAMDGFAVSSMATEKADADNPVTLRVCGFLAAGDEARSFGSGEGATTVEIMTGAPMPGAPYDAVVKVEDVEVSGEGASRAILLRKPVKCGDNVRDRASDFRAGQVVARGGCGVTPAHVMAFASLGISSVPVRARPKAAILSTGKELLALGERRTSGSQIWNSSGPYLANCLREAGCEVNQLGNISDSPEAFRIKIEKALSWGADLVVSTGAVSMGKHDFVVESLEACGAKLIFHKVAIRPGKPVCFGEFPGRPGHPVFFGLPGNPISTAVGLRFFVEPYVRALLRRPEEHGIRAVLSETVKKPDGLRCFYKARVSVGPKGAEVRILPGQGSYVISSFLEANCWAVLPEAGAACSAGAEVQVFLLNGMEGVSDG